MKSMKSAPAMRILRGALAVAMLSAAAPALAQTDGAAAADTVYELRIYDAPEGKLTELSQSFRDKAAEMFEAHGMTNVGYWLPMDPQDERIVFLLSYPDREARDASWRALAGDPEFGEVVEMRRAAEATPTGFEAFLMTPADYSPAIAPPTGETAHVYELRTYVAPPGRLDALNARFRDHTLDVFDRHGIENVAYFTILPGEAGADDTLIYFVAFADSDARDAAWAAFLSDPEWAEIAAESERDGPLLSQRPGSLMLIPTEYSPMQ